MERFKKYLENKTMLEICIIQEVWNNLEQGKSFEDVKGESSSYVPGGVNFPKIEECVLMAKEFYIANRIAE